MPITPSIWINFYFSSPQHAWNVDRQIFALAGWFCQARFQAVTPKQAPALLWFNMNVKSWGGKKKTLVQWVTRGTLTPYSYKRPVGCVAVREDKKNEEPHLGPVWRNVVFVCVCVFQALDLCHIIKILLSIKVEKVKWPSASSKQLDPPEHAYSHLALKKALRSNQFSEAQLNQREFTEMQYKMQWDLGSNKTLTHVIPKLQTATHIHRKPAPSYTLIIYRQTLMEVCVIYSFQL